MPPKGRKYLRHEDEHSRIHAYGPIDFTCTFWRIPNITEELTVFYAFQTSTSARRIWTSVTQIRFAETLSEATAVHVTSVTMAAVLTALVMFSLTS